MNEITSTCISRHLLCVCQSVQSIFCILNIILWRVYLEAHLCILQMSLLRLINYPKSHCWDRVEFEARPASLYTLSPGILLLSGWVDCIFQKFYHHLRTPQKGTVNVSFIVFCPFHSVIFHRWKKTLHQALICEALPVYIIHVPPRIKQMLCDFKLLYHGTVIKK